MNSKDKAVDDLAKTIDKAIKPKLHISDKVTVTPNVPGTKTEWSRPMDALGNEVKILVKPHRTTTVELRRKNDSVHLTVTKKF